MIYKEEVTKKELIKYLSLFDIIKIIPLKNDDPIFILKNRQVYELLCGNEKVIIHRGKFIWISKERIKQLTLGTPDVRNRFPNAIRRKDGLAEIPLDEYPTYEDYPNRYRNKTQRQT